MSNTFVIHMCYTIAEILFFSNKSLDGFFQVHAKQKLTDKTGLH